MSESYFQFLQKEKYEIIKSQLQNYRLDPFIRAKESQEGSNKGLIFPFARGLRFSALLIYSIREVLSGSDLEVSWGQIIDDEGYAVSGECDIIIHRKGFAARWNGGGGGQHIMDFRFIEKENALAVISCKSYITKSNIEDIYCKALLKYVDKIWLFAECCGPESVDPIKTESKVIGYENFWHLYTWSRSTGDTIEDIEGWYEFIKAVKELKNL